MLILEIVGAIYVVVASYLLVRLVATPDTTPIFYRWRDLLLCLSVMTLVSALWPVTLACEAMLETADDDEGEVRP